jgi:hypothetical protein
VDTFALVGFGVQHLRAPAKIPLELPLNELDGPPNKDKQNFEQVHIYAFPNMISTHRTEDSDGI